MNDGVIGPNGTNYAPEQPHDMIGHGIALCDALGIACRHMDPMELYLIVGKILREVCAIDRFRKVGTCRLDTLVKISMMTDNERWDIRDRVLDVVVFSSNPKE
jgi:hypothetical protein